MLHVLVTSRGTNEQTTVAQAAARPTEGYPSVGKNAKKISNEHARLSEYVLNININIKININ